MTGATQVLPVIDSACLFAQEGEAHNDKVILHSGEKLKVINIFKNDDNGIESTNFVNASLRLIASNQNAVRRVHIDKQGTWLSNTNTGEIFFIPEDNFTGESHIQYIVDSPCSYSVNRKEGAQAYDANITIIASTPTPCPQTKKPVCGQENLCHVSPSGEKICLASIPRNTTYPNMCELFEAGDVFFV